MTVQPGEVERIIISNVIETEDAAIGGEIQAQVVVFIHLADSDAVSVVAYDMGLTTLGEVDTLLANTSEDLADIGRGLL